MVDTGPEDTDTAPPGRRGRRRSPGMAQLRARARRLAVQALYQHQVNPVPLHELLAQFRTDHDFSEADEGYFSELVKGTTRSSDTLDTLVGPLLDRALQDLDPVERAILRMGAWELQERLDVPYRVVIDQGVHLAHTFGASESHRYVNAVLDKLARRLRRPEVAAARRG